MDKKLSKSQQDAIKVIKELGVSESEIISQVQADYDESIESTRLKRVTFERRDKLYLGIKDQESKVYVRFVYSVIDTLLALEHSDERSVIFSGRQVASEEYADNVNNVAKFDFEQMECEAKKYQVRFDKYMDGAGIEVMDGWDNVLQVPKYKVISPRVWCPDRFKDVNNGPRYHGFEYQASRGVLENDNSFFGIENCLSASQAQELTRIQQDNTRDQRDLGQITANKKSDILDIYYHYFSIAGTKVMGVFANSRSKLIKLWVIPAMTDIEKKDKSKIKYPVIVRHYRPLRNDPFGVCIPDLLEDKEQIIQLLINLNKIKAEHEALGDMFMFDPEKVDVNNLTIPALGPKYIPVTGMASMQGGQVPMMEVPKGQIKGDSMNMPDIIRQQGTLAVGMDDQTLGVSGGDNITATENQRVQGNANLRLTLGLKFDNAAEKEFWLRWYKFYLFYFNSSQPKHFALSDSVGNQYYAVKKSDFGGITDIDVVIKSKSDLDALKEKEKLGIMAVADMLLTDPTISESQRNFIKREMLYLNGMPKEKINLMIKPTKAELKAQSDVALLNKNEMPASISNLEDDHWTYIIIYNRAFDTDAKFKAINRRMLAIDMSGQGLPQQPQQGQQQGGSMGGVIMNDMMQQSNKVQNGAKSLQSISQ